MLNCRARFETGRYVDRAGGGRRWLAVSTLALVFSCAATVALRAPGFAYGHPNPRRWEANQEPEIQPRKGYRPLHLPPEDLPGRPRRELPGGKLGREPEALLGLTAVVVLPLVAQWLAAWMRVPTALLLLVFGCVAGPLSGVIEPDLLFGGLLVPLLSIVLALSLFFEALAVRGLGRRPGRRTVLSLTAIGLPVSCAIAAAAAYFILQLSVPLAVLLGLILGLTGPPGPLASLRRRSAGQLGAIVSAERTFTDLVGTLLIILVFEATLAGASRAGASWTVLRNDVIYGLLFGAVGGALLLLLLQRGWIPRFLDRSAVLALVVTVFTIPNLLQAGAGYLAVITMGVFLANRDEVMFDYGVRLRGRWYGSLLAAVFFLLIACIRPDDLLHLDRAGAAFVIMVILITRPLAVWVSTLGSALKWRDQLLLSLMAPRGVFALGLATICARGLARAPDANAAVWVPLTVLVVAGTVTLCPLAALLVRRQAQAPDAGVTLSRVAHVGDR